MMNLIKKINLVRPRRAPEAHSPLAKTSLWLEKLGIFSFLLFFLFTPLLVKIRVAEGVYVEPLMPLLVLGLGFILSKHLGAGSFKRFWLEARRIIFPNWLAIFYFLLIGLLFCSFFYGYSITGFFNLGDPLRVIKYGLYFLPFPLAIYAGRFLGPRGTRIILAIFVAIGIATAIASFTRVFSFLISGGQIDFWNYNIYNRSVGFLGQYFNPIGSLLETTGKSAGGTYGIYASVVLAVCLAFTAGVRKFRSLGFGLIIISSTVLFGAILYALSRGAAIVAVGVIAGWALWLLRSRKIKVILASLFFMSASSFVLTLINPQVSNKFLSTLRLIENTSISESGELLKEEEFVIDSSTQGRFYRWEKVLEVFKIYPPFAVLGVGYNSQNLAFFTGTDVFSTHSLFLDLWARGGLLALGLVLAVWVLLLKKILDFILSRSKEIQVFGLTLGGFAVGWLLDNLISGEQFFSDAPMIAFWGTLGLVQALANGVRHMANGRKKVLIALTSSDTGGAPKVVYDLLKQVRDMRQETGDRSKFEFVVAGPPGKFLRELKKLGYRVYRVRLDEISFRSFKDFLRIVRKEQVDLINSHGKGAGLYARLIGSVLGVPVVQTFHGLHYEYKILPFRFLYLWLERFLTLFTKLVINVSRSQEREGVKLGIFPRSKSRVVANGIDVGKIKSQKLKVKNFREKFGIGEKDFAVAMVARFDEVKGHLRFIGLVPDLVRAVPNLKIVFVGGPTSPRLRGVNGEREAKSLAKKLGVRSSVAFLGERDDVPKILQAVDAFVLPSYHEGLPISVLEALAAGLPIIGSNVVGIKDCVVDGKTGYLVDFDNPVEVARTFKQLAKSSTLRHRMGERGRDFVAQNFGMDKFVKKTLDVYQEALTD